MLSIVNERVFDNGPDRVWVPLRCLVCASNEVPETEETTGHVWRDVGDVWGGEMYGERMERWKMKNHPKSGWLPQLDTVTRCSDTYEKGCDI